MLCSILHTRTEIRANSQWFSHLWCYTLYHWHQFKMTELLLQRFEELIQMMNALFSLILWKYQRNTITKVSTPNKKLLCQKYVNQIRAVCHLHDILSFRWKWHANLRIGFQQSNYSNCSIHVYMHLWDFIELKSKLTHNSYEISVCQRLDFWIFRKKISYNLSFQSINHFFLARISSQIETN